MEVWIRVGTGAQISDEWEVTKKMELFSRWEKEDKDVKTFPSNFVRAAAIDKLRHLASRKCWERKGGHKGKKKKGRGKNKQPEVRKKSKQLQALRVREEEQKRRKEEADERDRRRGERRRRREQG